MIRARTLAAAACAISLSTGSAGAHPLAPALLSIDEQPDGAIAVSFKMSRQQPAGAEIAPELPEACAPSERPRVEEDAQSVTVRWTARCGAAGIVGARFGVRGLAETGTNALVRVALADGRRVQAVLHAGAPSLVIPERASALGTFRDYLRLGALHIGTGFDHLLFVFGLVLLARGTRLLLWTVTAFTAGHSVTLSLAALGVVRFPTAPIEVAIAATILVLALELARTRDGLTHESLLRRRPWVVAFAFGLLHGLGFAGALAQVGLPQEEIPVALFSFNVGIELGQVTFVLLVLALRRALAPALAGAPAWLARAPITAMGSLAFYWCLDRAAKML
ncbi:MAG: HupE/UreJ family protein [Deltaproteobacteria bacterium]|nr:MAG: HupE/UreJ family protein [Deltaproteobacteria bacterium]